MLARTSKQTKKKRTREAGTACMERGGLGYLGSRGGIWWTRVGMTDYAGPGAKLAPGPALSTLDHALAHGALHELVEVRMQHGSSSTWCTTHAKPDFFF